MIPKLCPYFRRFLIERNLLVRFHLNMIMFWCTDWKGYCKARRSLAICKPYSFNIAFEWSNSFEGESFWDSIDRKWGIQYRFLESGGLIKSQPAMDKDTKCNK